ncbi:hypothetical protein IFM89_016249 [Coptis chinensis]|uniref:Uncharacterized protein n=1 Tax=Coptis chinensis TaxID=261450 RepID=A0A835I2M7_9MAGN|nr:hypothetical protein IFM89_016249 [Coptis chinensis]
MITRSKLAEQLRDYQFRSQQKWAKLIIFSPKLQLLTKADVNVARLLALLFSVLVISAYMTLYFRRFRLSFVIICLGILLPICLKISRRRKLAKKRERRMLLPLSM